MIETEDPDFVASWQKVEEALKRLDENQVERLFSMKYASLADFHQAQTKELELKAAALESAVASLKDENKAIENFKIKSETKKLREERERMSEELLQKKRISPIQRPHYIPSSYTYQFFEKSYSCIVFRVKDC